MTVKNSSIAFTGGGTGGHVFPAFAVIEELEKLFPEEGSGTAAGQPHIFWIGQRGGMEEELVKQRGIPFYGIPAGKLRRYFSLRNFTDLFRILAAFFSARRVLKSRGARLLFSKGGFVSVPPVLAARSLGIPVISHESDLDPGLATRINAPFSSTICCAYEETRAKLEQRYPGRVLASGNPVRRAILEGDARKGRELFGLDGSRPLILVLGGSQGARQVNELVSGALEQLTERAWVVHQMGEKLYQPSGREGYITAPFFTYQLPHLLAAADLVISRSGAGTLWENGVTSTPAILIPLGTGASRGDQVRNARLFANSGAALILEGAGGGEPRSDDLADAVGRLLDHPGELKAMAAAAKTLCPSDGAARIARLMVQSNPTHGGVYVEEADSEGER